MYIMCGFDLSLGVVCVPVRVFLECRGFVPRVVVGQGSFFVRHVGSWHFYGVARCRSCSVSGLIFLCSWAPVLTRFYSVV